MQKAHQLPLVVAAGRQNSITHFMFAGDLELCVRETWGFVQTFDLKMFVSIKNFSEKLCLCEKYEEEQRRIVTEAKAMSLVMRLPWCLRAVCN